jgi:outer membrane protein OmpA-like peptidoglycan-associated protein
LLSSGFSFGQKAALEQAELNFQNEKYKEVISILGNSNVFNSNGKALFIKGISHYYNQEPDRAIIDLLAAYELKINNPMIFLYVAKSFYVKGKYLFAAENYKNYLRGISNTHPDYPYIIDEIKRCEINNRFTSKNDLALVDNMGSLVNTSYDETNPKQSPNYQNKYYFSSDRELSTGGKRGKDGLKDDKYGNYFADMYAVELTNGNWTSVSSFNPFQNTSKTEIIQGFNSDGSVLYYLQSSDEAGDKAKLFADTFNLNVEQRAFPKENVSGFDSNSGDKDLYILNDSTWIFSSNRQGGHGGFDIYIMQMKNSEWQNPKNLGPKINSNYDEVGAFMSKGTQLIFFSSNRKEGYGGFDIFYSSYSANKEWGNVVNIGLPINSPADDKDFFIASDGNQAIMSSNRINGIGGYDLYLVYLKNQILDQLEFVEVPLFIDTISSSNLVSTPDFSSKGQFMDIIEVKKEEKPATKNLPIKEFVNPPLYFNAASEDLTVQGSIQLNNLIGIMKIFPNLKATIYSHSSGVNTKEFNLFFTSKRAEKIIDKLAIQGIAKNRFEIIALGDNFPLVDPNEPVAASINNRIEFRFYGYDKTLLRIENDEPMVRNEILGSQAKNFQKGVGTMMFSIKIAETSQMLRSDIVKEQNDIFILRPSGKDTYEYFAGVFTEYKDARALKVTFQKKNLLNAEIIPFLYGQKLTYNEALLKLSAFPVLEEYLRLENK